MRYWVADWPYRRQLKDGHKEGIPPYPLRYREVVIDQQHFVGNWLEHREKSIFYSVVFPPDIDMNRNIRKVKIESLPRYEFNLADLIILEGNGVRFAQSKMYKNLKLPEMLLGLGT